MINITIFLVFSILGFLFYWCAKTKGFLWITKAALQIGIPILFIGSFFKLFVNLPSDIYIRLIFCLTYIWCTVGINVNFMIPLINLIDQKIDKNR